MTAALLFAGIAAFGFLTGTLSGVLGVGGGIFVVPFMVLALGVQQQHAQATSLVMILPTAVVAVITLRRRGVGDLRMTRRIGMVGAVASLGGAALALHLPASTLRALFAGLLVIVGVRLLWDANAMRRSAANQSGTAVEPSR